MIKFKNIIIDGNNLFARNWYVHQNLSTFLEDGTELKTGGIFGFIKSLVKIERELLSKNGQMYVLFDNHNSKHDYRKKIDPQYKANRTKKDSKYYKSLEFLQLLLLSYKNNYKLVYHQNMEADDLVIPILNSIPDDTNRILLVSDDLDWARCLLIRNNTFWYTKNSVIDRNLFQERFGFKLKKNALTIYKAFRGDSSDNIPKGVSGIREKDLIQLIDKFDSIDEIFKNLKDIEFLSDSWKEKIKENQARLILNYKLVDFLNIDFNKLDQFIFQCNFEKNKLIRLYRMLKFDIKKIDNRYDTIYIDNKDEKDTKGFFQYRKIKRI